MIDEGADIIDIGGESTRPGSEKVSLKDEISRTINVIKLLREINSDVLISIDTSKSMVAKLAMEEGANIVNDVSSYNNDKKMILERKNACLKSSKILGISKVDFLNFPDMSLDTIPHLEINRSIEKIIKSFKTIK